MKIILAGGSGFLGKALVNRLLSTGHNVVILTRGRTRTENGCCYVNWDGVHSGPWVSELDGADAIINLAGKSVNCRYTRRNKDEILQSRVMSVKAIAQALQGKHIPVWIQSSSATIYRHAEDKAMTESSGEIGSGFSVNVCKEWEKAFLGLAPATTRKIIMRTGIVFDKKFGAFPRLKKLAQFGLGGKIGNGNQYISWLHVNDFVRIVEWMIGNPSASGIYNCTAPVPVTNRDCMAAIAGGMNARLRLPSPEWLLAFGALVVETEPELVLKSRWVFPERLEQEGFSFRYGSLAKALPGLV